MPRPRVSMPPDAIRIEDEVWQEAFARREPSASRAARRLRALEGGGMETAAPRPVAIPRAPRAAAAPDPARATAVSRPVAVARPVVAARPVAVAVDDAPPAAPPVPARGEPVRRAGAGVPGRPTVTIRGRGAERNIPWPDATRRRPPRRAYERAGFKPDRVAMWAVFLGMLLVLVAVMSAHG